VIISARPVPGNELRVHDAINQLAKAGAFDGAPPQAPERAVMAIVR